MFNIDSPAIEEVDMHPYPYYYYDNSEVCFNFSIHVFEYPQDMHKFDAEYDLLKRKFSNKFRKTDEIRII